MKKNAILSLVLVLSCLCANSADWINVNTNITGTGLSIDLDSVRLGNKTNEYLYSARYLSNDASEKVMYLKSNLDTNKIGVIRVENYDIKQYRPNRYLNNSHTFMKNIKEGSILEALQDCISSISQDDLFVVDKKGLYVAKKQLNNVQYGNNKFNMSDATYNRNNSNKRNQENYYAYNDKDSNLFEQGLENTVNDNVDSNIVEVNNYTDNYLIGEDTVPAPEIVYNRVTDPLIRGYLIQTCQILESNWTPPRTGHNTKTILDATIGSNGELLGYNIVESSGNQTLDQSAVSTLEKSAPYNILPLKDGKQVSSMSFQFVFERGYLIKRVVY